MNPSKVPGPAVTAGVLVWMALLAIGAASAGAVSVSSNWAGYVALPSVSVGPHFSSVSGTWTQPSATCSAGGETFSAAWVGLGGYSENAQALEQIGTDVDCARSGQAGYSTWYELIPAAPVSLKLKVHPGNEMTASVTVHGHDVTLRIRDLSTGTRFTTTKRVSAIDVSSAEWIVEAPSVCASSNACETLALTDFGNVAFSSATATVGEHTGTVTDPGWSAEAQELRQNVVAGVGGGAGRRFAPTRALITAAPSAPPGSDGAFSVSWQEQSIQVEQPTGPRLPGFSGGPP
jgi:WD40 repeat protein